MRNKDYLPWQHDLFESLARRLKFRLNIANIDGVMVLTDLSGGRNIIKHRASIVSFLDHLYAGVAGACLIAQTDSGWVGIEINGSTDVPPLYVLTETTIAGALAQAQYFNGQYGWSRWSH